MQLSILIPSIPDRMRMLSTLVEKLNAQIGDKPVELISLLDNKKIPVGSKRNRMMRIARGKFLTHLDDDDDVSDDYIDTLLDALKNSTGVDVITFNSRADLGDNMPFTVHAHLGNENEQTNVTKRKQDDGTEVDVREDIKRAPWHWCVWRTEIARKGKFPTKFMGEDWNWIQQVIPHCTVGKHIDKVLHFYFYRENVSISK